MKMVSYIESHFKCYVRQHLTKSKCKVRAYIKKYHAKMDGKKILYDNGFPYRKYI